MRAHLHLLLVSAFVLAAGAAGQRRPEIARPVPDGATLVALADGTVACVWLEGANVQRILSRTDGRRWGEPQAWGQWPGAAGSDFAIASVDSGEVLAIYADVQGALWSIRSTGRRRDWAEPVALNVGAGCVIRRITRVGDRWIAPFGQRVRKEAGTLGFYQGRIAWSDDAGASWQLSESRVETFVRSDFRGERLGAHAPVVAVDGERVLLFASSGTGRIYRAESKDRGESWLTARPTRGYALETPIDVVPAPAGGLYVARQRARYGERDLAGARSVLHLARTENLGASFAREREIHADPRRNDPSVDRELDAGWPSLLVLDDAILMCAGRGDGARHLVVLSQRFIESRADRDGGDGLEQWTHRGLKAVEDPVKERGAVVALSAGSRGLLAVPAGGVGRLDFELMLPKGTEGGVLELLDRFVAPGDPGGDAVLARIEWDGRGIQKLPLEPDAWHPIGVRWNLLGAISVGVGRKMGRSPVWLQSSTRTVCYVRFVGADGSSVASLIGKTSSASFDR